MVQRAQLALVFASVQLLAHAGGQVIYLDDMDQTGIAERRTYEGLYAPCQEDAYKGQFHHDWAENKGASKMTFTFDPPADGCYRIEEHHPGRNPMCSRYLPRNTKLRVEYCRGKEVTGEIDQSTSGGRWNTIGTLPFYIGQPGRLHLESSPSEVCGALQEGESCFLVADAFRITFLGSTCKAASENAAPAEQTGVEEGSMASGPTKWEKKPEAVEDALSENQMESAPAEPTPAVPTVAMQGMEEEDEKLSAGAGGSKMGGKTLTANKQEGFLTLKMTTKAGPAGAMALLAEHVDVLEAALSAHIGSEAVVLEMAAVTGRRLSFGASGAVKIHFFLTEDFAMIPEMKPGLDKALQQAFDEADADLVVQEASMAWGTPVSIVNMNNVGWDHGLFSTAIGAIMAGCAVLALIGMLAKMLWDKKHAKSAVADEVVEVAAVDEEAPAVDEEAHEKGKDEKMDDVEIQSVSTATPGSNDGERSEGSGAKDDSFPVTSVVPTAA